MISAIRSRSRSARALKSRAAKRSRQTLSGKRSRTALPRTRTPQALRFASSNGAIPDPGAPAVRPTGAPWPARCLAGPVAPSWTIQHCGIVQETARANVLMLDFDFRRVPRVRPLWSVLRVVGLRPTWIRTDRTRRGWHVIIGLTSRLQPAETVALQAILGSDDRREALNLMRVIAIRKNPPAAFWKNRWNLLFSSKLQDRQSANKRRRRT
jgi:hypothetical protein